MNTRDISSGSILVLSEQIKVKQFEVTGSSNTIAKTMLDHSNSLLGGK